jgi:hypothetical protein
LPRHPGNVTVLEDGILVKMILRKVIGGIFRT